MRATFDGIGDFSYLGFTGVKTGCLLSKLAVSASLDYV